MRRGWSFLRVTSLVIMPVLLGAMALLAGPAGTTAAAGPGRGELAGVRIAEPRPGLARGPAVTGPGALLGVAAISARDAWAVGLDENHLGFTDIVIERWTGLRWRPVRSPVPEGLLTGVAAASSRRAWAVGSPEQLNASLILTWDGTAWH
jgi:hypothetical protein